MLLYFYKSSLKRLTVNLKTQIDTLRFQPEDAKAENQTFQRAISKLPTPERLHEMIVTQYQEFYRCTKRIAHFDASTRRLKRSWETRILYEQYLRRSFAQDPRRARTNEELRKALEELQHSIRDALQDAADIHHPEPKQEEVPALVDEDVINDNIEFVGEIDDLETVDGSSDEPAQQKSNHLRQHLQNQLRQARQGKNDLIMIIVSLRNQKTCQPRRFERGISEEILRQLVQAQDKKEAYEERITELERNLRALG
ncbi:unnamed protein product [Nippostrongylus brasiliensis]|uniref:Uncharacterized protein n=1 Tax=Nippostrongylus brasiliensis TaxID=27835 RepID=A0A0N4XY89_NIPBR|nr:unnamed protein product [Nippostrongylus brasiliensis]